MGQIDDVRAETRPEDHDRHEPNDRDSREFNGKVRGPDLKEAIRSEPEKANKLAAGLAAWAKGAR
jgi:hypothetical protein